MKKYLYIIAITTILLLFILYFFLVREFYPALSDRALFGDMFGGVNALFSGFAFLGVIYAILLQKEELQLQRKELELTREELKKSAEAQEKSEKALSKQAESLKVTAKLNGLSAILRHHDSEHEISAADDRGSFRTSYNNESPEIIKQIKAIIENK